MFLLTWGVLVFVGMISLLQKMLQLYAAKALYQGNSPTAVDEVISAGEEQWDQVINQMLQSDSVTENEFLEDVQKRMESTVLGQSSGSYTQRVQVSKFMAACCLLHKVPFPVRTSSVVRVPQNFA